jgi:beta-lactamase superfamily II metal-dependent hydrolase
VLLCGWTLHHWRESDVTRLSVIPVNGGMAIYFDARDAKNNLLVDCGNSNSVQFITKPFLRAQGVNELPALALTHGDLRHVGGAELVMDLFRVPTVAASPVPGRSPVYRKILKDLSATPEKLRHISRTNVLGAWTVLHPERNDHFPQADDNALVLDATFEGSRVLLFSDLGLPGQEALMQRTPNLRADILITGLPVQNEAVCEGLLDAVQPRVIIVVDSEDPAIEQAKPKLHERLARRNVPVIYTRFAGATTIEWWDKTWRLRTMSGIRMTSDHLATIPDPLLEEMSNRAGETNDRADDGN